MVLLTITYVRDTFQKNWRHPRESVDPAAFIKKTLGSRLAVPRNFALRARFRGNDEIENRLVRYFGNAQYR
jgi:hypothetical protein